VHPELAGTGSAVRRVPGRHGAVGVCYRWRPNPPDEYDNRVLELAVAAGSAAILTFNQKDFWRGELRARSEAQAGPAAQSDASLKPALLLRSVASPGPRIAKRTVRAGYFQEPPRITWRSQSPSLRAEPSSGAPE